MEKESQLIVLREATTDDIGSLVNLRKFLLNEGTGHYVARSDEEEIAWQNSYKQWLHDNMHSNEKVRVVVSHFLNDIDISACGIGIVDERVPMKGCLNGRMGWIQTIVVHPKQRRKGLAENIVKHILEWFKSNDVGKVALQTTPMAKDLYEKLGFIDSGEELLLKEL